MTRGGYLPNIAEKFGRWEQQSIKYLAEKNFEGAAACLNNLNALLTEEYLISIDTEQYQNQMQELVVWSCRHCNAETQKNKIRMFDLYLCDDVAIVVGYRTEMSWRCPDCLESQPVKGVNVVLTRISNPYYPKFMYEEPKRGYGLELRFEYPPAYRKWFFRYLELLQHQLALYRIEYKKENDGEEMIEQKGETDALNS